VRDYFFTFAVQHDLFFKFSTGLTKKKNKKGEILAVVHAV
jgi:hypothetical protein